MAMLEARGLVKRYAIRSGVLRRVRGWVRAVDGVSVSVESGETLGLVGESGCGKTTLGRLVMGLLPPDGGEVLLEGRSLSVWLRSDRAQLRRRIQLIFQDPLDSLDPRFTIQQTIAEPLRATARLSAAEIATRVRAALEAVQLPADLLGSYPHELSGGQRQRVGVARALVVEPSLIVCDEPVSSLDLSIQAEMLRLLRALQQERRMAYLFISHDLSVVEVVSHRIAVMYLGSVVELAPTAQLLREPWHPYTEALLAAVPRPDPGRGKPVRPLGGEPPSPSRVPSGCRFRTRCPIAQARCEREEPPLVEKAPGRFVACHFRP